MNNKTIYVKVTERCNLQCNHCYAGCTQYGNDMSSDTFKTVLKGLTAEVKNNPDLTYDVILHGGEPLLKHDYCRDLVEAFLPIQNVSLFVTTNLCYNLTEEILDTLKLIHNVSTSYDPEVRFKNISQLNLWNKNCKILKENGINLQINCTLTQAFIQEKPYLRLRLLKDFKANSYHLERLSLQGRGSSVKIPKWEDVDDWLVSLYQENKNFNLNILLFEDFKQLVLGNKTGCFCRNCTVNKRTINTDGTVATCPNAYNTIIGNITEKGFMINKPLYNFICLKERERNIKCLSCPIYSYCNGDCFQQSWQGDTCAFPKKLFKTILEEVKNEKAV